MGIFIYYIKYQLVSRMSSTNRMFWIDLSCCPRSSSTSQAKPLTLPLAWEMQQQQTTTNPPTNQQPKNQEEPTTNQPTKNNNHHIQKKKSSKFLTFFFFLMIRYHFHKPPIKKKNVKSSQQLWQGGLIQWQSIGTVPRNIVVQAWAPGDSSGKKK